MDEVCFDTNGSIWSLKYEETHSAVIWPHMQMYWLSLLLHTIVKQELRTENPMCIWSIENIDV